MTRDEIYDHLAQVYLGKKDRTDKGSKRQFNAWLVINIIITIVILASTFYGLTAFFVRKADQGDSRIIYALTNGPIRITYNLTSPYPPVKDFSLSIPKMNAAKYSTLRFSVRGMEEGYPGVVKIVLKNQKNETAVFFVKGINLKWQEISIPLEEFSAITDWSNLTDLSFVLEAWNAEKKKGIVLIDNLCFST